MADPTQEAIRSLPKSASAKTFAGILDGYAKQGVQFQDSNTTDRDLNRVCNELYAYAELLRSKTKAGVGEFVISRPSEDYNKIISLIGKFFGALGSAQSKIQIESAAVSEATSVAGNTASDLVKKAVELPGKVLQWSGLKYVLIVAAVIVVAIVVWRLIKAKA